MHRHFLSALLLTLFISGCATTTVSEFKAPDGSSVKSVKCTSDPAKCFLIAAESCKEEKTYKVLSSESHAGGILADILPGPVTWYAMNYSCGPSDGRMPDFKFTGQQYTPPPVSNQIIMKPRPSTTNCTRVGNNLNCNSY